MPKLFQAYGNVPKTFYNRNVPKTFYDENVFKCGFLHLSILVYFTKYSQVLDNYIIVFLSKFMQYWFLENFLTVSIAFQVKSDDL